MSTKKRGRNEPGERSWLQPGAPIFFSIKSLEHGFLSNMHPVELEVDGRRFGSSEHFFQWRKMASVGNAAQADRIESEPCPKRCKRLGGKRGGALAAMTEEQCKEWDARRLDVMREALRAKFAVGSPLHARLLETGDRALVERLPMFGDPFWGVTGKDAVGCNWLGVLLMELRGSTGGAAWVQ